MLRIVFRKGISLESLLINLGYFGVFVSQHPQYLWKDWFGYFGIEADSFSKYLQSLTVSECPGSCSPRP